MVALKIALPTWNDRIAPVFDVARQILVVEVDSGEILRKESAPMPSQHGLEKALDLARLSVNVLICGAISRSTQSQVQAYGIEVYPFIAGEANDVLRAWMEGKLEQSGFAMPGCGQRRGRCRGRGPGRGRCREEQDTD